MIKKLDLKQLHDNDISTYLAQDTKHLAIIIPERRKIFIKDSFIDSFMNIMHDTYAVYYIQPAGEIYEYRKSSTINEIAVELFHNNFGDVYIVYTHQELIQCLNQFNLAIGWIIHQLSQT